MFHIQVPSFNINGRDYLRTGAGGIVSFFILYVTLLFALLKFTHLMSKHNPQVNAYVNPNAYTYEDVFDLKEERFKIAFGLEKHATGEPITDLRYFKWAAMFYQMLGGEMTIQEIPMRTCTESDFAEFYPVDVTSESRLERLKDKQTLLCLD